jgi:hypothetical protein
VALMAPCGVGFQSSWGNPWGNGPAAGRG